MWTYSLSFARVLLEIIRRWLKQRLPQKPTTHISSVWIICASTHICYANICPLEGHITSLITVTAHSCIWPAGVTKVFIFNQQVSESRYNTDSSCTLMFLFFSLKKKEINNTNCSFSTRKIIPVIMFNSNLIKNRTPALLTLNSIWSTLFLHLTTRGHSLTANHTVLLKLLKVVTCEWLSHTCSLQY